MIRPKNHMNRVLTAAEREQAAKIRIAARKDFPPKQAPEADVPFTGIAAQICEARKTRGLTRYSLAQQSGVPSVAIRDMEQGIDVPLSQVQAVARVLGLSVELVEHSS